MKYAVAEIPVKDLIKLVADDHVTLRPSYQRNEVWLPKDQRDLIKTVLKNWPIPSIFIYERNDGPDEMVDGKQRTLALFNFVNDKYLGPEKKYFSELSSNQKDTLLNYRIPLVIIKELGEGTRVEEFYALVNKSGLSLNRPEVTKAEHSESTFFKLVDRLTSSDELLLLDIFTERNKTRFYDFELISEVLASIVFGLFDKKTKIDDLFLLDQPEEFDWQKLEEDFNTLLRILNKLNDSIPLKNTRFKKRADFLSLCFFYHKHSNRDIDDLVLCHQVFYNVSPGIAPSNRSCDPLRAYAHNCVSQSNSKLARENRDLILNEILINDNKAPSRSQNHIIKYFGLTENNQAVIKGVELYHLNPDLLSSNRPDDHLFGEPESIQFKL